MEAKPQTDLHAKVYMSLILGQDSCSVGKSNICQLFEDKGDIVLINTVIFFFSEN